MASEQATWTFRLHVHARNPIRTGVGNPRSGAGVSCPGSRGRGGLAQLAHASVRGEMPWTLRERRRWRLCCMVRASSPRRALLSRHWVVPAEETDRRGALAAGAEVRIQLLSIWPDVEKLIKLSYDAHKLYFAKYGCFHENINIYINTWGICFLQWINKY